ncbi:MAG: TlpA family protein disulfide reductase [Pyrinomonadaceae bacterium]
MNHASPPDPRRKNLWTPARLVVSCAALAFIVAFGATSCSRSTDVVNNNAATKSLPSVSVTGGTPANNAAARNTGATPATAPNALPAKLLETEFKGLDGKAIKLSDYAGKVVVLDMWATWCPPCREEIPHLVSVSKEYAGRGVEVIGLDIDPAQDDAETVRSFAKKFNVNYKLGWAEQDAALTLMRGNGSIPQTLVISRDGRVVAHFRGYSSAVTPDKMRTAIDEAVNDKSAS